MGCVGGFWQVVGADLRDRVRHIQLCRSRLGYLDMRNVNVVYQQSPRNHAGPENHHGRYNDFPLVHGVASPWSTEASSVFSKFCERSSEFELELSGAKNAHAPHKAVMARQDNAARHSPCTQTSRLCGATRDLIKAVTRFSNA